jgi:hypothetical protein
MATLTTPHKTDIGWVIDLPDEIAASLNVPPGSVALLYTREGALATEILPPPTPELEDEFERLWRKHEGALKELKRLGD